VIGQQVAKFREHGVAAQQVRKVLNLLPQLFLSPRHARQRPEIAGARNLGDPDLRVPRCRAKRG
jgi:hypothetical protein